MFYNGKAADVYAVAIIICRLATVTFLDGDFSVFEKYIKAQAFPADESAAAVKRSTVQTLVEEIHKTFTQDHRIPAPWREVIGHMLTSDIDQRWNIQQVHQFVESKLYDTNYFY